MYIRLIMYYITHVFLRLCNLYIIEIITLYLTCPKPNANPKVNGKKMII
uniref:Uncharacterized protein n=1 Tax=Lepeophtheirus salmonis TaxID=72036 RepID=A0A0K2V0Z3_LEPSM